MALVLQPKVTSEVLAIKLKDEILGLRGQWLLIDRATDKVIVADDNFVNQRFVVKDATAPSLLEDATPTTVARTTNKNKTGSMLRKPYTLRNKRPEGIKPQRFAVDVHGKRILIPHSLAEVLSFMRVAETKEKVTDLLPGQIVAYATPGRASSASSRLVDARKAGFVTSKLPPASANARPHTLMWTLTNEGRYIADRFAEAAPTRA